MTLEFAFPYKVEKGDDSGFTVTFPDVPEAITGSFKEEELHALAHDALICALISYVEAGKPIPMPRKGSKKVYLRPLEAAKLALHVSMLETRTSQVALAHELGKDARQVRRMLDLDHSSKIEDITTALRIVFGKRLVTSLMAAA